MRTYMRRFLLAGAIMGCTLVGGGGVPAGDGVVGGWAATVVDLPPDGALEVLPDTGALVPADLSAVDPGIRPGTGGLGGVIAGVTAGERQVWLDGRNLFFSHTFSVPEGLGPRFNSTSCLSCHSQPAVGGTAGRVNPQAFIPTDFPGNKLFSFIRPDGPILEARVLRKPDGTPDGGVHALFVTTGGLGAESCTAEQEDLDAQHAAGNVSFRIPTPVFGAGLIENIEDREILRNMLANAALKRRLGINGKVNRNGNDGTITRFGWKAQNKSLELFAGEAMNVEQGITNDLFPTERDENPTCQGRTASNDFEPVDGLMPIETTPRAAQARSIWRHLTFLMRFHKQPSPVVTNFTTENGTLVTAESTTRGADVFAKVGCALCHTPVLQSNANAQSAALRDQRVGLFSDLLLHDMGRGLADGVRQGEAGPREFRTAPLWNVGQRMFLLHDGRTSDMVQAVREHESPGSEASHVIRRLKRLSPGEQQDLVNFLRSL